jgi:hypothetical protein
MPRYDFWAVNQTASAPSSGQPMAREAPAAAAAPVRLQSQRAAMMRWPAGHIKLDSCIYNVIKNKRWGFRGGGG